MIPETCWIVTETGLAGTLNQCLGVAEALGVAPEVKSIALRQPWKSLSPWLGLTRDWSFVPPLEPPWPDLLIASGRKAAAAALHVKKHSGGRTFVVQIQDPRISAHHFDLLAVPAHDPARGSNVIVTAGAPNRVSAARLTQARKDFPEFESFPAPRLAVLIGGSTRRVAMTADVTARLIDHLKSFLKNSGGSTLMTASRRTGLDNTALLRREMTDNHVYFWDGKGQNPYFGLLGWADAIAVTSDSVSMISESCTTGKPVYMITLEGQTRRLEAFHRSLLDQNRVRPFTGSVETHWPPPPLNDADIVATEIRRRLLGRKGL
ncbi:MAG: mitochondrial fission ELM1 family protein [Rhodospirillales bacterium]|nr:mitochondrial fission ELM1 family protein [Rhodospirillales bacterium]